MQQTGPSLSSAWDLVLTSSVETKVVLAVTATFCPYGLNTYSGALAFSPL